MARRTDIKKDDRPAPPSASLAFIIGLVLFSLIFCPAGVFVIYNFKLYQKLQMMMFHSLTLGCLIGIAVATIPAFIFMYYTMKKVRKEMK